MNYSFGIYITTAYFDISYNLKLLMLILILNWLTINLLKEQFNI